MEPKVEILDLQTGEAFMASLSKGLKWIETQIKQYASQGVAVEFRITVYDEGR